MTKPTNIAPLSDLEKAVVAKLVTARFPLYTASKRFARDLDAGHVTRLSDRGRAFLAYVTHRFRRQYDLSADEQRWVETWLNWREPETHAPAPVREQASLKGNKWQLDLFPAPTAKPKS